MKSVNYSHSLKLFELFIYFFLHIQNKYFTELIRKRNLDKQSFARISDY